MEPQCAFDNYSLEEDYASALETQLLAVDENQDTPQQSHIIQHGGDGTMNFTDNCLQSDQGVPAPHLGGNQLTHTPDSSLPNFGVGYVNASVSDPSQLYYQDVGDMFTVNDFLMDQMIQGSSMHDLPPPPPGGDQLVQTDAVQGYLSDASINSNLPRHIQLEAGLDEFWHTAPPLLEEQVFLTQADHAVDPASTPDSHATENHSVQTVGPSLGRRWPVVEPGCSIGVGKREDNGTWEARIWLKDVHLERWKKGMQCFLGSFTTEEDAKRAHDKAAIMLGVRVSKRGTLYSLNYPEDQYADYIAEYAHWSRRDYLWKMRRENEKFSRGQYELRGITSRKRTERLESRYTASISLTSEVDGKRKKTTMTIGHFDSEGEAGRAYDKALLFIKGVHHLGCITNFPPENYTAGEVEEAGRKLAAAYPKIDFQALERKRCGVFG